MSTGKNEENIFVETLIWICDKLDIGNIPYMITGGAAVGFWGQIRTTMDIDILVQIQMNKIGTFFKSIENDAYIDIEAAQKAIINKQVFNIIFKKTYFRIDLIPLKEDAYEQQKFGNRTKLNFQGRDIYVISPEDLIISKLQWSKSAGGSERQIQDCASIYQLNYEMLNLPYLNTWIKQLNLEEEFKRIVI